MKSFVLLYCQEWGWIARRFDPGRSFATPRPILSLIGPDPRVIADDIWAKLLWAGLNLSEEDLPSCGSSSTENGGWLFYPLEMVRAMAVVWLFAGLRSDEIRRLHLGCIRWQQGDTIIHGTDEILPKKAVCLLDIPINKTGTAFTKPVDPLVGEAIAQWESIRPVQPAVIDRKTGQCVHYLFSYRGVPRATSELYNTAENVGSPLLAALTPNNQAISSVLTFHFTFVDQSSLPVWVLTA